MIISRIRIVNFRSIENADVYTSTFNILVGQNNCGKTNVFEALQFFFSSATAVPIELRFAKNQESLVEIEVFFTGAQDGMEKMSNEGNKTKIKNALDGSDTVSFKKTCRTPKRQMFVNGIHKTPGTGFDAALNDFLPKFEYVSTKQYYDSVAKYGKTTAIGVMLADVIAEILSGHDDYKEFQKSFSKLFRDDSSLVNQKFKEVGDNVKKHLIKQFAECADVNFSVSPPNFEDFLKGIDTNIDDGILTSAEDKGDGMQRALMLAIINAYADFRRSREEAGKSFLFFIDEAELHLHPLAQRNLKDVLYALSEEGDQVFINTHSSVFVADNYPGQRIFRIEKQSGATILSVVEEKDKPDVVYELLGGSPADLLLPRNFLIVEGESEFEFFTKVIKRFYADKPPIQIIKARGDLDQSERVINALEKTLSPLAESVYQKALVVLVDRPHSSKEQGMKDLLARHKWLIPNERLFQLPFRDLEQYYPEQPCTVYGNWRKTQEFVDGHMDGHKKRQLAKHVGNNISQSQFENDMRICYQALNECWNKILN